MSAVDVLVRAQILTVPCHLAVGSLSQVLRRLVTMAVHPARFGEPFTVADLEGMPDDGRFYELSHGALVVTPGPNTRHQHVASRLFRVLVDHLLPSHEVLVGSELHISDDTVKRPDVQVVDRRFIGGQRIMGTPALVVEITSSSTAVLDRTEKRIAYAEAGIPAYWLVDPEAQTITVLELEGGEYVERAVVGIDDAVEVDHPTTLVLAGRAVFET